MTDSGWINGLYVDPDTLATEIALPLLRGMDLIGSELRRDGIAWSPDAERVRLLAEAALKRHQSRNVVADVVSPIAEALSSSSMEGESRRTVTPTEVARRFGIERQGVLSRLKRGRTLHGEQDERGQWHVEISEVEAAYGRSWDDENG